MTTLTSKIKHSVHCCAFFVLFAFYYVIMVLPITNIDPWKEYGYVQSIVLYILSCIYLISVPQMLVMAMGLLYFNQFPDKETLNGSLPLAPFLCFRVVTRGSYPDLVKDNVKRNFKQCEALGLENFIFEVVTDNPIGIIEENKIREIIVPSEYRTATGVLYKARALQYALEDKVNVLQNDDWIVHLDEETLLTESSIIGIVNFVLNGEHQIGQGAISYVDDEIVNILTTLLDSFRITDDFGSLQFQLRVLHRPIFSIKGSFLVVQNSVEREVSFDHGIESCIAEDNFFATTAAGKGYKFNFIQGLMVEKSAFTLSDFIKQRTRWSQGLLLLLKSSRISPKNKLMLYFSSFPVFAAPLILVSCLVLPFFPLPTHPIINVLKASSASVFSYTYIFGVVKSFDFRRFGIIKVILLAIGSYLLLPFTGILQSIIAIRCIFGRKDQFYIVNKNMKDAISLQKV
ncbi:beta-1,4-mannosyltransferase egh-like [Diabrotica virgifera virgifera]|uniref:Glycosyltransferase 2-like domain-containing protein n=2 Tax=Diabrotica virgifera virgifera TaxID=50390 RepID=A0ABM5KQF4_DIAVI|nr:beta-1,4-mannosyltransferase egh-like [Diabrotica virgifera virgifera]